MFSQALLKGLSGCFWSRQRDPSFTRIQVWLEHNMCGCCDLTLGFCLWFLFFLFFHFSSLFKEKQLCMQNKKCAPVFDAVNVAHHQTKCTLTGIFLGSFHPWLIYYFTRCLSLSFRLLPRRVYWVVMTWESLFREDISQACFRLQ